MPSDLTISAISAVSTNSAATNSGLNTANSGAASASSGIESAATPPIYPNPSLHIDPSANLVVMNFRNTQGEVVAQIPTPQQLAAYTASASAMSAGADVSSAVA